MLAMRLKLKGYFDAKHICETIYLCSVFRMAPQKVRRMIYYSLTN
ncbi:hypothetical protein SAMN04515695_6085 [Pseudovibrio sp. Tun.PSC04-5.I4]|nr:hypothetical protein SAMN04515695_6085 [Pseudovibrio sp. Tun.PSC04-5.I4]